MFARRISGFHIFGVAIVSLCLAIAILAQKKYVQNTKITVAETNAKAFSLWFIELNTSSKKSLTDKEENCQLFADFHPGQCFLKELISQITFGDLANLKNPFIEGEAVNYGAGDCGEGEYEPERLASFAPTAAAAAV